MKKTLTILLVVVMSLGYASQAYAGFRFGSRVGLNVNKMHFNQDLFDGENQCGFNVGVQAEYMLPIVGGLGVDLSLLYSYMDPQVELNAGSYSATTGIHDAARHFLEIPLNIKYKFTIPIVSRYIAPYVFTGPAVAFKLGNHNDAFSTSQWVWNIGIGVELIRHLQIGASYGFGMNNAIDGTNIGGYTVHAGALKAKNNYWTVSAAWMF